MQAAVRGCGFVGLLGSAAQLGDWEGDATGREGLRVLRPHESTGSVVKKRGFIFLSSDEVSFPTLCSSMLS